MEIEKVNTNVTMYELVDLIKSRVQTMTYNVHDKRLNQLIRDVESLLIPLKEKAENNIKEYMQEELDIKKTSGG